MSRFRDTQAEGDRECPYCGYTYQPEAGDFHDDVEVEECEECGKKYRSYDEATVEHIAKPDCELNNQKHVMGSRNKDICRTCGRFIAEGG